MITKMACQIQRVINTTQSHFTQLVHQVDQLNKLNHQISHQLELDQKSTILGMMVMITAQLKKKQNISQIKLKHDTNTLVLI